MRYRLSPQCPSEECPLREEAGVRENMKKAYLSLSLYLYLPHGAHPAHLQQAIHLLDDGTEFRNV